jgi:hypothetical protein
VALVRARAAAFALSLSWNGRIAAAERTSARERIEEQAATRVRRLLGRQRS